MTVPIQARTSDSTSHGSPTGPPHSPKGRGALECAGRAQRRRRFGLSSPTGPTSQSGVALRLPPHSIAAGLQKCMGRQKDGGRKINSFFCPHLSASGAGSWKVKRRPELSKLQPATARSRLLDDGRGEEDDQFLLLLGVHLALEEFSEPRDVAQKRDLAGGLGGRVLDEAAHHDGFALAQADNRRGLFNVEHRRRAESAGRRLFLDETGDRRSDVQAYPPV